MRNRSGARDLPADAGDEDKAGYDNDLTVTLYTSLAVSSSALNMATLFKQQASAAGVTVNLNQVSASSFFGPNYYTKVPFSQIYYDYSPYLSQVAQTFLPTSPFPETHFNDPTYTNQGRAQVAPPGPVSAATPVRARLAGCRVAHRRRTHQLVRACE
jgi:ABC-type transport system substrate-binding protein